MKVALLEISESHEECIYTQVCFLKDGGYNVTLLLNHALAPQVKPYQHLIDDINYFDLTHIGFIKKIKLQWWLLLKLKSFDLVIFNTASSSKMVRNLVFSLNFFKVRCIGILHNTKKLGNSFTQKIISTKIKKYFVLNDYLTKCTEKNKYTQLESLYPIFFPKYAPLPKKSRNQIWICVPGRLDYDRRNYDLLLQIVSETAKFENLKFIFLGKISDSSKEGSELIKKLKKKNILDQFILFDNFVPNNIFHAYVEASDYIMPLLKPKDDYLKYKITGSFNMAFAYKKTLLCNCFFKEINDLSENAIFYSEENLGKILKKIAQNNCVPPTNYRTHKWGYAFQKRKYLNFIRE